MTSATTFSMKNPPDSGGGPGAATDGKPRDRCADGALADEGRILLVDDEEAVRRALARELGAAGRRVDRCADPREAVQRLARDESAWIVFDDRMPDLSGMALMEQVRRLAAETLRFLLTAHPDLDSAVRAINEDGVHRFLSKPWKQDEALFDCTDRCRGYFIARLKDRANPVITAVHRRWRGASPPLVAGGCKSCWGASSARCWTWR